MIFYLAREYHEINLEESNMANDFLTSYGYFNIVPEGRAAQIKNLGDFRVSSFSEEL